MRNPTWQDQDRARGHWCVYWELHHAIFKLYLQVDNDYNSVTSYISILYLGFLAELSRAKRAAEHHG